jgi:hypothetical protein
MLNMTYTTDLNETRADYVDIYLVRLILYAEKYFSF